MNDSLSGVDQRSSKPAKDAPAAPADETPAIDDQLRAAIKRDSERRAAQSRAGRNRARTPPISNHSRNALRDSSEASHEHPYDSRWPSRSVQATLHDGR